MLPNDESHQRDLKNQDVIKKILQRRTSPQTHGIMGSETPSPTKASQPSEIAEYSIDYSASQVALSDNGFYVDPEYPVDLSV